MTAFDIMFNFSKQGHFKNIHAQEYSYLYSSCKRYSKIKDYKQKFEAVLLILRIKNRLVDCNDLAEFEILGNLFLAIEKKSNFQERHVCDSWLFVYFCVTEFSDWGKLTKNSP